MKKFKFSYVMLILALAVAGCAGYFSIFGLSQLFAGASIAVIIMASVLEIGKVITTTALHRYWKQLANGLRVYLTISVVILMFITSAGIYGFLSNAYQKTANKLEIHEGSVGVLDNKKQNFEKNIRDNEKILDTKNKRIDQLTSLRMTQENRFDLEEKSWSKNKIRSDIEKSSNEIQTLSKEIDVINNKNLILSDSINLYNIKILELNSTSEVSAEVGPLKYISELTGVSMGRVVNYLILLLIFVFDPLAIALVLITNRVFQIENEGGTLSIIKPSNPNQISKPIEIIDEKLNSEITPEEIIPEEIIPEEIIPEEIIPEEIIPKDLPTQKPNQRTPVIPTGKIELEDIRGVKDINRGYSVKVPSPKNNNTIQRINSLRNNNDIK